MKNDYKNILRVETVQKDSVFKKIIQNVIDGAYEVFFYILKDPINNIFWESISLIIQYLQLILFVLDETVSFLF